MAVNMKGRSILSLMDNTPEEIRYLLDIAKQVKAESRAGIRHQRFVGKTLALIFEKRSTRTRLAFETAFAEEGGHPIFLSIQDIQLGAKESIEDTARVLGRMVDAIEFRGFKQETVEILAKYSGVPVYNGLTDLFHPTQVLADLQTIEEEFGRLKGIKLVSWVTEETIWQTPSWLEQQRWACTTLFAHQNLSDRKNGLLTNV